MSARPLRRAATLERLVAGCQLWEMAIKLLGAVALIEYADRCERLRVEGGQPDAAIEKQLRDLARPSLGHWCGFRGRSCPIWPLAVTSRSRSCKS